MCLQDEGDSLQQQFEREKEALQAEADKAWQQVGCLEMEAQQAAARAAQEMEALKHNHALNQVSGKKFRDWSMDGDCRAGCKVAAMTVRRRTTAQ